MSEALQPESMPALPRDDAGPVFNEPWEAQAFAVVLALYRGGHFTWPEWVAALSEEIGRAESSGDPRLERTYYQHWLTALETLLVRKELAKLPELHARRAALEANPPDRHGHAAHRDPVRVA